MRIFVVGLGSIGSAPSCERASARGTRLGRRLEQAASFAPDALVVASPTSAHLEGLRWAVDHGVHAYVEKPIAASPNGVAERLAAAEARDSPLPSGTTSASIRRSPSIRAAVRGGQDRATAERRAEGASTCRTGIPMRITVSSYAARRELGGGAVLTLSHELDYVRWIAGEVVECRGLAASVVPRPRRRRCRRGHLSARGRRRRLDSHGHPRPQLQPALALAW